MCDECDTFSCFIRYLWARHLSKNGSCGEEKLPDEVMIYETKMKCMFSWENNLLLLLSNMHPEPWYKPKDNPQGSGKHAGENNSVFPWTSWILEVVGRCPEALPLDAALKLTHPDADSALRVSRAWKRSAESHKSPNAPVIAVLLSCQG